VSVTFDSAILVEYQAITPTFAVGLSDFPHFDIIFLEKCKKPLSLPIKLQKTPTINPRNDDIG